MPAKIDKVVISNFAALKDKYGSRGLRAIRAAVARLIAADKGRGLNTVLVDVDSKAKMKSLSAARVIDHRNCRQNKEAIDGVYKALMPDYIMILGSRDVIPHQDMKNPLFTKRNGDDPDQFAWGDLPYACDAPYSKSPNDFTGPTRVVGRLPDITGGSDHGYLVGLLKTASEYKRVEHDALKEHFAISAQVWQVSTKRTLRAIFRTDRTLQNVPPQNERWKADLIKRRIHLFNCHGAHNSSRFYGQPMNKRRQPAFPTSLDATFMDGKIGEGTIVAAECCYGGQLYALSSVQPRLGMTNVYLKNRSYAFFGSTTIAYGPARNNGQADLICRFFIQSILDGASLGRAVLEARQKFARHAGTMDPTDFKTLAQFNLYGDPSITPLREDSVRAAAVQPAFAVDREERHERRRMLALEGSALQDSVPRIRKSSSRPSAAVMRALHEYAKRPGLKKMEVLSFSVQWPAGTRAMSLLAARKRTPDAAYHVALTAQTHRVQDADEPAIRVISGVMVKEVDGKPVSVSEIQSR